MYSKFKKAGATVVALSVDTPFELKKLAKLLELSFPVYRVPLQVVKKLGLQEGRRTHARPATFVVDAQGRVVFQHMGRSVRDRPKESALLRALQGM